MNSVYKLCAWVLIVSFINLQVPVVALAADGAQAAKQDGITKNRPEMVASPEVPLPAGAKPAAKKSYTWLWWVLGAVVVGAAAAGGGGGGGGGGGSSTGSVSLGW
jgi:hypothetical protein